MTRQDYELIAAALRAGRPKLSDYESEGKRSIWEVNVKLLTEALEADNPRFDRERFLRACGV